jgi:hypothetical protein
MTEESRQQLLRDKIKHFDTFDGKSFRIVLIELC